VINHIKQNKVFIETYGWPMPACPEQHRLFHSARMRRRRRRGRTTWGLCRGFWEKSNITDFQDSVKSFM